MQGHVCQWGNSLALRLPKVIADSLHIGPTRPSYKLADLLADITPDNEPESCETPPVGAELL